MNTPLHSLRAGLLSVVLAAAGIACSDDPFSPEIGREEIMFTVLGRSFEPGDTIVATLGNRSERVAGYNLCFTELERRIDSGWQRIQRHPPNSVCPAILLGLAPGASASLTQPVREDFPTGLYRFRTDVHWPLDEAKQFTVTTGTFAIGK